MQLKMAVFNVSFSIDQKGCSSQKRAAGIAKYATEKLMFMINICSENS